MCSRASLVGPAHQRYSLSRKIVFGPRARVGDSGREIHELGEVLLATHPQYLRDPAVSVGVIECMRPSLSASPRPAARAAGRLHARVETSWTAPLFDCPERAGPDGIRRAFNGIVRDRVRGRRRGWALSSREAAVEAPIRSRIEPGTARFISMTLPLPVGFPGRPASLVVPFALDPTISRLAQLRFKPHHGSPQALGG